MSSVARIMDVYTFADQTQGEFIAPVGGTLETLDIDGRWSESTIREKVEIAISKRLKNNIIKARVGYAVYGQGMRLKKVVILDPKYANTPRQFL